MTGILCTLVPNTWLGVFFILCSTVSTLPHEEQSLRLHLTVQSLRLTKPTLQAKNHHASDMTQADTDSYHYAVLAKCMLQLVSVTILFVLTQPGFVNCSASDAYT